MNNVLKSISYIFHPLLMPLLGVIFYFSKTPRFIPDPVLKAKLFSVTILTVILPMLLFYLLKTLRKVDSVHLETTNERKLPLLLNSVIIYSSLTHSNTHKQKSMLSESRWANVKAHERKTMTLTIRLWRSVPSCIGKAQNN